MDAQISGIQGIGKELPSENMTSAVAPFSLADLFTPNETQSPSLEELSGDVSTEMPPVSTAQRDEVRTEALAHLLPSVNAVDEIEADGARSDSNVSMQTDAGVDNPNELAPKIVMLTESSREVVNAHFSEQATGKEVLKADAEPIQSTPTTVTPPPPSSKIPESHNQPQVLQQDLFGPGNSVQHANAAGTLPEKQGVAELPVLSQAIPDESVISQQHTTETMVKVPELLTSGLNDFFANKLDFSQMGAASKLPGSHAGSQENSTPDYRAALFELKSDVSMKANYQIDNFTARIKMYPPNLGEINAKISVHNGQTSISMITDDNQVKQIIEINLPKLRESFESSNLTLTDIDIRHDESSEKQKFSGQKDRRDSMDSFEERQRYREQKQERTLVGNSIVDIYA